MADDVGVFYLLKNLDDGLVMEDLCRALSMVQAAVKLTHKKGSVVLEITVEPEDVDVLQVGLTGRVTLKAPQLKRRKERFYLTEDNILSRRNPRQPNVPENTINMPTHESNLDGQSRASGEK